MFVKRTKLITLVACLALVGSLLTYHIARATTAISINSCQQLQKIGNDGSFPLGGNYKLSSSINCTSETSSGGSLWHAGAGFEPIGSTGTPFTGTFDGQGFSITGLHINRPTTDNIGLFGDATNATISNLNLRNTSIIGQNHVGSFIGSENGITIENVSSNIDLTGANYIGGIIGFNVSGAGTTNMTNARFTGSVAGGGGSEAGLLGDNDSDAVITESYSTANVIVNSTGEADFIGGLVGDSDGHLTITKSYATGNVTATSTLTIDSVGGLVGWSDDVTISDSFATGNVTATAGQNVGGLIGVVSAGTISNSYSAGAVSGDSAVGGFIGNQDGVTISHSFYDLDTSGQDVACGNFGGCDPSTIDDLTTAEIKNPSTFTNAGWDYANTWHQASNQNSGYPYLVWPVDHTTANSFTGKNLELIVPAGCHINSLSVGPESSDSSVDSSFNYPDGLMNFAVDCGRKGFTSTVTAYFYGVKKQTFSLRKYNLTTKTYANVPGASISFVTINGQSVAKVTYSITDGGSLDNDGSKNGIVVDPVGLAVNDAPGLPDTGLAPVQ